MCYRRHSIAICAVLVCLALTTACGSSTTVQFKTGYAAAQVPLNRTFVDVSRAFHHTKGKSISEIGRDFGALAERFGAELGPLESLKPPSSVATAFTTLTASLGRVEHDMRRASAELRANDVVAAAHWLERLTSDAGDATDAATAVAHKLGDR